MGLIGKIALIGIVSVAVLIAVIWDIQNEKAASSNDGGKAEDKIAENLPGNLTPQDTPNPESSQGEEVAPEDTPEEPPEDEPGTETAPVEKPVSEDTPEESPKEVVDKPELPEQKGTPYTIQKGDTLSGLARKFYGDPKLRHVIQQANVNVIPDPEVLRVGEKIQIPSRPELTPAGPTAKELMTSRETYIVQPRDTLSKISRMHYGDSSGVELIYQANKDKITDKNVLKPGTTLIIPPMPKKEDK